MARKAKTNEVENVVINEAAGVAFENAVAEIESANASEYGVKADPMEAAEDTSAAEENAVDVAPVELSAPVAAAPVFTVTEAAEYARRKYQRKEESEKAKRDRLTVEKMPEKIFKYNTIPDNIGELSIEEKRVVLSAVIEKNNELLDIYNGIGDFMQMAHGGPYDRKAEYLKIVIPNKKAIEGENRKARNMALDTYGTLPAAIMDAMKNVIKNADGYKKDILGDLLQYCRENLFEYIVFNSYYGPRCLLDIVFAGVPALVLTEKRDDDEKLLTLAGYKENGRYIREEKTVDGVGRVAAVDGVIYAKK